MRKIVLAIVCAMICAITISTSLAQNNLAGDEIYPDVIKKASQNIMHS
jgi:hypothetical protein